MTTQRIHVSGKVQGVGYRDFVVRQARTCGITGWVRNTRDGRVEMLASGDDEALARFVDLCRGGPMLARVDHIEAYPDDERPAKGFTKRFTA
ncbi:acylphosphatase [Sphingomonas baiyangensis]|uniref:acylphosphatase n=1 Tax=Sphingomonas baiyangensis TaxID=2572576 RepID=A0A4U1L556_9SPHN|nr:acylphosphatase [Sphingomonas baiyangensis]TKD51390.1 acylphosphatase [Sphingomonas baiyangensis]